MSAARDAGDPGYGEDMKLPVAGPRDLYEVLERGADRVEALLGVVPRMAALLDHAEALIGLGPRVVMLLEGAEVQLGRVAKILDDVGAVTAGAASEVAKVERAISQVQATVAETDAVVALSRVLVDRLTTLLDRFQPSLTTLQPTLEVLADTTDPSEVAALVATIDILPELASRLEHDVLPVMSTLATVAPDLHDLLAVSRELNEIIGKLPGLGRIKRRVEEDQQEEENAS